MIKIVFVCLGNICRSPSAEGILKKMVLDRGLSSDFYIDSAGTSAFHVGEGADKRMKKHAIKRGYKLISLSRQFNICDYDEFDYIIAMDHNNLKDIYSLDNSSKHSNKIKLMTDFSKEFFNLEVPDPYYGGSKGFDTVIDILEESCKGFFDFLCE